MRTVVFINPHSRRAAHSLETVQEFFAKHKKFEVVDFIITEDLGRFDTYITRLKQHKNIACVIVGSGDGTIMSVLNALKNRQNLTFGFLPLGTTNVFAHNLGLSVNLKKSLETLAAHEVRGVNLGSVNDVLFMNFADIGLTAQVAKHMSNRAKRRLGTFAYYWWGLKTLVHSKPFRCYLQIGKQRITLDIYNLSIVNGNHYGPVSALKEESVYNNTLSVVYSTDPRRFGFLRDANSFFVGRQYKRPSVAILSTARLTIKTDHPKDVQADGEIITRTPAEVKIVKDAIRVLVPRQAKHDKQRSKAARRKHRTAK